MWPEHKTAKDVTVRISGCEPINLANFVGWLVFAAFVSCSSGECKTQAAPLYGADLTLDTRHETLKHHTAHQTMKTRCSTLRALGTEN